MGAGELARAHKASCFKSLFPFNGKGWGELRRCAPRGIYQRGAAPLENGDGRRQGMQRREVSRPGVLQHGERHWKPVLLEYRKLPVGIVYRTMSIKPLLTTLISLPSAESLTR